HSLVGKRPFAECYFFLSGSSQTRALVSALPETRNLPSAENAREVMASVCPSKLATFSQVVVSQTSIPTRLLGCMVSSGRASSLRSGENADAGGGGAIVFPATSLPVATSQAT